jgi:hypothetical protein
MKPIAVPLLLVSVMGVSPVAPAPPISGFMDAERLSAHCSPASDAEAGMGDVCLGYLAGAADQLMNRQSQLPAAKRSICIPSTTTIGDIKIALLSHLDMLDYEPKAAAAVIVERALAAAFPC